MGWFKDVLKGAAKSVTSLNPIEQTKGALEMTFAPIKAIDVERIKGWADDQIGETRREQAQRKADAQARANAQPDEFDVLLREAAFSAAQQGDSALSRTFAMTPRGIEGPAGKMPGKGGLTTGDLNIKGYDDEDFMIGMRLGGR